MDSQKYSYKFFQDNYSYKADNMFRKYYKQQEKKYRYSITVNKDINSNKYYEMYRSNESSEEIISQISNMDFQVATIRDFRSQFPNATQYKINNIDKLQVVEEYYKSGVLVGRKILDGEFIFTIWNDNKKAESCRISGEDIYVFYDGISVYNNNGEIIVHKSITLSQGYDIKYDSDVRDRLEKILKRIIRDNTSGYYSDMIDQFKIKLGVR